MAGILALALAEGVVLRRRARGPETAGLGRAILYTTGLLALALALLSPLDRLSDVYLFSAHMLQHLLLLEVVPTFLLLGAPAEFFPPVRRVLAVGGLRWLSAPLTALLLSCAVIWLWHLPLLYELALGNEAIHAGEHLCFLVTATLFWWPVLRPETHPRPSPELLQFPYLLAAAVSSTMLAALITFSANVLYPTYALAGPWATMRLALGWTPLVDQQVGGLLMWIVGGMWYLGAAGYLFQRWFSRPDEDEASPSGEPLVARFFDPVRPGLAPARPPQRDSYGGLR
jgi:cytochrome c oxidase assembly factor CtaG